MPQLRLVQPNKQLLKIKKKKIIKKQGLGNVAEVDWEGGILHVGATAVHGEGRTAQGAGSREPVVQLLSPV